MGDPNLWLGDLHLTAEDLGRYAGSFVGANGQPIRATVTVTHNGIVATATSDPDGTVVHTITTL